VNHADSPDPDDQENDDNDDDDDEEDQEFPKTDVYLQAERILDNNTLMTTFYDQSMKLVMAHYMEGATQYGCIHSIMTIGAMRCNPNLNNTLLHLAQPWFVEGAIRGSRVCAKYLIEKVYSKAQPHPPKALQKYWGNWIQKIDKHKHIGDAEWTATSNGNNMKLFTADINRKCIMCKRRDTDTLTLRQCMGCSTYCYCSEHCQTNHWVGVCNHKNECKQLQILTKYHKPYAKEVRLAAIRRETHPALEKLRHKLGLTRPTKDYEQLRRDTRTETFDETGLEQPKKDPFNYIVARPDGTVWFGSPPNTLTQ